MIAHAHGANGSFGGQCGFGHAKSRRACIAIARQTRVIQHPLHALGGIPWIAHAVVLAVETVNCAHPVGVFCGGIAHIDIHDVAHGSLEVIEPARVTRHEILGEKTLLGVVVAVAPGALFRVIR